MLEKKMVLLSKYVTSPHLSYTMLLIKAYNPIQYFILNMKFNFLEDEKESTTEDNSEKNKEKNEVVSEKNLENGTDNANISGMNISYTYFITFLIMSIKN